MLSMKDKGGGQSRRGNADIGDDVKRFAEFIGASWGQAGAGDMGRQNGKLTLAAGANWHRCTLRRVLA